MLNKKEKAIVALSESLAYMPLEKIEFASSLVGKFRRTGFLTARQWMFVEMLAKEASKTMEAKV
jgi:hypothetical protein